MTPYEVNCDVLTQMPPQSRLPELSDYENAEMYKKVCQAVRDHQAGKPPAMRVPLSDIPRMLAELRAQLQAEEPPEEQE